MWKVLEMKYILEVYTDDKHPDETLEADSPFPSIAVGDFIHPAWRMDHPGTTYNPGDRLEVQRVEHVFAGDIAKTMLYSAERPWPRGE